MTSGTPTYGPDRCVLKALCGLNGIRRTIIPSPENRKVGASNYEEGLSLGTAVAPGLPSLLQPAPPLRPRVPATLVLRRETLPPETHQRLRRPRGKHFDGILAWHASHLSNGLLEGINSLIQAAKARARGYRNKNKMITIIYLTAAALPLPTLTTPGPRHVLTLSNPLETARSPNNPAPSQSLHAGRPAGTVAWSSIVDTRNNLLLSRKYRMALDFATTTGRRRPKRWSVTCHSPHLSANDL
jgi:Transposase